ncbi:MAG: hypothetical protein ACXADH_17570 [Candidatus Kariarchaeaceae archaeon]|jgi:hypothetical protein
MKSAKTRFRKFLERFILAMVLINTVLALTIDTNIGYQSDEPIVEHETPNIFIEKHLDK